MSQLTTRVSIYVLPVLICGCSLDWPYELAVAIRGSTIPGARVPTRLAAEFSTIQSQLRLFSGEDHPLATVTPGTVIGPAARIIGCWGSARSGMLTDDTGQKIHYNRLEILRIYPQSGRAQQEVFTIPTTDAGPGVGLNRVVHVNRYEVFMLSDSELRLKVTDSIGGVLLDTGEIVFNLRSMIFNFDVIMLGLVGSLGFPDGYSSFSVLFTVDGDYLRTDAGPIGAPDVYSRNIQSWVRLECIE